MKRSGPPQRKTPLKPGKGLDRGKGLESGSTLGRGRAMKPRSVERQRHMTEDRIPLVEEMIANDVGCEICPLLDAADVDHPPCAGIQGMHERRKSSSGGSRVNRRNLMAACNWSNGWVEDSVGHPEGLDARTLFGDLLVVREGDREWELLGKRLDRL